MAKVLTEPFLKNAVPPASGRVEHWDAALPGFGVRITANGVKTFVCLYRVHGRKRRLTIGRYPAKSLADARAEARKAMTDAQEGRDAATERRRAKAPSPTSFEKVAEAFIEGYAKPRKRSWEEDERVIKRELKPLNAMRIDQITRADLIPIIDAAVARGARVQANRILALARKLFGWCVERGYIDASPVAGLRPPSPETSRDRTLSDQELRAVLAAADGMGHPLGPFVRLLVLTGQRLNEVAKMKWSEVDLERALWTMPATRTKASRAHAVPLSPAVVDILKALPRFEDCAHVLSSRGKTAIGGFSKWKVQLDEAAQIAPWRFHDLRRTCATGLAQLGTPTHVISRVLNHATGGVTAIYDRYQYEAEMRAALERWAARVAHLMDDESSTVVALRK